MKRSKSLTESQRFKGGSHRKIQIEHTTLSPPHTPSQVNKPPQMSLHPSSIIQLLSTDIAASPNINRRNKKSTVKEKLVTSVIQTVQGFC